VKGTEAIKDIFSVAKVSLVSVLGIAPLFGDDVELEDPVLDVVLFALLFFLDQN